MDGRKYTVSRDLGHTRTDGSHAQGTGLWYVHMEGWPNTPVFGSFTESEREARAMARRMSNPWT